MPDQGNVAVFWDYENCAPPLSSQGYAIVNGIRRIAHIFGRVTMFKTYLDMSAQPQHSRSIIFRSELQSSGVSMIDCPHNGRKDVVDKMILVDMLAFAIDHHSPATVILIAGDRDYAYAMSTLRLRQYTVVLIVPSAHVPESLVSQASVVIDWNYAILRNRSDSDTPPVRQPYRDLDEDIFERLVREIQDLHEDPAVTLISSSRHTVTATAHTHVAQPAPMGTPKKATGIFPETPGHRRVGSAASRARSTTQSTQSVPDIDRDSASPFTANETLSDGGVADDRVSTANEIQNATYDPFVRPPIMSPRLGRYHEIAEPGSPPIVNLGNFPPSPPPSATFNLTPSHSRTISGGTPVSYNNPPPKRTAPAAMPSSPTPTGGRSDTDSALKSSHTGSVSAIMDDSILPSDRAAVMDALGLDDENEDSCGNDEIATNVSTNSPRLTEVEDDPSHTYVMNAISSCSKHDIARTPPANDTSPPITEPSGTPMSQQSLLAPSAPDPNITMPNVGIGSPTHTQVIPSVISDNSGNHSLGYQAFPIESVEDRIRCLTPQQHLNLFKEETIVESVEDKIRRITPPRFHPLINQLLLARSGGIMKPTRSMIAKALIQHDKDVYASVGVTRFGDYASQAQQASIVELGGQESQGEPVWIKLHPNLFKAPETTPKSPPPLTAHSGSSLTSQDSVEDKVRHLTPPQFLPLINQLLLGRSKGIMKPGRSTIAVALSQCDKDVYTRAGVNKFKDYASQAEQASLVELGGLEGDAWIALHPSLFKEEITPTSPTPSPIQSNSSSNHAPQDNVNPTTSSTTPPPHATTPPLPAVVDIPLYLQPLITCLVNVRKGGMHQPLRSSVGLVLGPAVYAKAGVGSMKEYLALAVDAGTVEIGGADGHAWVRLHPDVLSGKRTCHVA